MTFPTKYSEKQKEKVALHALLDEYFDTRRAPPASSTRTKAESNSVKKPFLSEPILKNSTPSVKPKVCVNLSLELTSGSSEKSHQPPLLASRMTPVAEPPSSPLPRGPPPINRSTRPTLAKTHPVFIPPPPLETPAKWAGRIPNFQYPSPDHSSPGIDLFNRFLPHAVNELHSAAISIFEILYSDPSEFKPKNVQSPVSLIMRDMNGVAHAANSMSYSGTFSGQGFPNVTHRSDFVFSTQYLTTLENHSDASFEIRGIIFHELTHTFQYAAENSPGGLTEGIADFVRLRGGYAAKHWTENPAGKTWDQGYETTAYFLDWVEKNIYEGLVAQVNDWLGKNKTYDEAAMFDSIMPGWSWGILWEQYLES